MNRVLKKSLIAVGSVLGGLIILFLLAYFILFIVGCFMYSEARDARAFVCNIPDINSGYAPQGIAYAAEIDSYLLSGYDSDGSVALYVTTEGGYKKIRLTDSDGHTLTGHAGGIACTGNNVFLANDHAVDIFDLTELDAAEHGAAVERKHSMPVNNNASYCHSDDKYLYVGEFYRDGNYPTSDLNHYETPSGAKNKAIVSCYRLNADGSPLNGVFQPLPEFCISVTDLVQGFAVADGVCILSRSYGLKSSELQYHSAPKDNNKTVTVPFELDGKSKTVKVPLYYLDDTTLFKTLTLPAFAEDVTINGDRVVVTNEASANKYFIGKLFNAAKVFSYPIYAAPNAD